jgi:hypothetical protein
MYFNNKDNYVSTLPPNFNEDHYSNIAIFDTEPNELREFPLIIISGSNGNMITSGLGDMATEVYDPVTKDLIAYKYGGMYEFNITIEIGTKSTLDREILTDIVTRILRFTMRRNMESDGVLIKSMNYGGESAIPYDTSHIYVSTISLSTWSEWYEDIKLLPFEGVKININK